MASIPIIYGSIISLYVRKTILILNHKKISYELKPLNPFDKVDKEFILTLNPIGKVPIYQKGDYVLWNSSVTCACLEKTFPEPAIFPKTIVMLLKCHIRTL